MRWSTAEPTLTWCGSCCCSRWTTSRSIPGTTSCSVERGTYDLPRRYEYEGQRHGRQQRKCCPRVRSTNPRCGKPAQIDHSVLGRHRKQQRQAVQNQRLADVRGSRPGSVSRRQARSDLV